MASPIHNGFLDIESTVGLPSEFYVEAGRGAKAHFFQPPTPSPTSNCSTPQPYHITSNTSRKRLRPVSPEKRTSFSFLDDERATTQSRVSSLPRTPNTTSPLPLVNTQYSLAGGLDTPSLELSSSVETHDDKGITPELNFRNGRAWSDNDRPGTERHVSLLSTALSRERNGQRRGYISAGPQGTWRDTVYTVVGGVASKVSQLCRTIAFRGFYAGGGPGYPMKPPLESIFGEQSMWQNTNCEDGHVQTNQSLDTSVSGNFPSEDFIPDYMSQDLSTPPRAAKKIQREKGEGELRSNWIMVGDTPPSLDPSPSRPIRRYPRASIAAHRPTSKAGRKVLPLSRPSLTSSAGSPALRFNQPASFASPRSPTTLKHESPVNFEAQRYAARVRKREMEEAANIRRLNQQLKDMIRQGKEALGTKVEIEDIFDDEYHDDVNGKH